MDIRQLSYFLAVADERQFTRAAERLLIAQPAVSAQIRQLERELGEVLFHRDRRETTLTAAGEALLPHARAALAAVELGYETIASLRGVLHGHLRIGVAGPVDGRLARALGIYRRQHPGVQIRLGNDQNAPLIEALADGEIDAGIIGLGAQALPADVKATLIDIEPLVIAVPSDHSLADRKHATIDVLRDQPLITLVTGSGLRTLLEQACHDAGFRPDIVAETADLTSLVHLVAEAVGLALTPRSSIANQPVTALPLKRPRLERRTALAWNSSSQSPATRAFLQLAHQTMRGGATLEQ